MLNFDNNNANGIDDDDDDDDVVLRKCFFDLFLAFCQVSDSDGKEVPSQVNVWWDHRNRISTAKYEVSIVIPQPKFSNAPQSVSAG